MRLVRRQIAIGEEMKQEREDASGKEEQGLLNRGRQVREHQDLADAHPANLSEFR